MFTFLSLLMYQYLLSLSAVFLKYIVFLSFPITLSERNLLNTAVPLAASRFFLGRDLQA